MNSTVYFYVCDTMADWEISFLSAELNSGRFYKKGLSPMKVVTVAAEKASVTTMGGLRILPDINIEECVIKNSDALILPGANTWNEAIHQPILNLVRKCMEENVLVGAICGATFGLAQAGLLDSKWHTSNDLGYLKMTCPNYRGEAFYMDQPAVTDGKLITASGVAPLEFTTHVLRALDVFSPQTIDAWYKLYTMHQPENYFDLMNSLQ